MTRTLIYWLSLLLVVLTPPLSAAAHQRSELKWEYDVQGEVISAPVVDAEGTVYASTSRNNHVWAIYADGSKKWAQSFPYPVLATPVLSLDENSVYVTYNSQPTSPYQSTGFLTVLDTTSGRIIKDSGEGVKHTVFSGPAVDTKTGDVFINSLESPTRFSNEQNLYVYSERGKFLETIRSYPTDTLFEWPDFSVSRPAPNGREGAASILQRSDGLYQVDNTWCLGNQRCRSRSISPPMGDIWDTSVSAAIAFAVDTTLRQQIYVAGAHGILAAYPAFPTVDNPQPYWTPKIANTEFAHGTMLLAKNGIIYLGGANGYLYAVNPDGTTLFDPMISLAGFGGHGPNITLDNQRSLLYAVDNEGGLWAVDLNPVDPRIPAVLWYVKDARATTAATVSPQDGSVAVGAGNLVKVFYGGRA